MSNDNEQTDGGRFPVDRRSMLTLMGAGGASLAMTGGLGSSAAQVDGGDGGAVERCEPCIDPYTGYLAPGGGTAEVDAGAGGNATDGNVTGGNATGGNETAGGAQVPSDAGAFDPAVTVTMNVGDADVVFPDDGAGAGGLGNESDGSGNESAVSGNESAVSGNETSGEQAAASEQQPGFPDFYFDPVGVGVSPGDVVAFESQEEVHTVTAYSPRYYDLPRRIPEDAPGFSSPPVVPGDTWYYRFDQPGVYDLYCLPHEQFGMVVRVVVTEEGGDVPQGYDAGASGDQPGGTAGNETAGNATGGEAPQAGAVTPGQAGISDLALSVFQAPEMDPENIVEEGPIAWTDLSEVDSQPPAGD